DSEPRQTERERRCFSAESCNICSAYCFALAPASGCVRGRSLGQFFRRCQRARATQAGGVCRAYIRRQPTPLARPPNSTKTPLITDFRESSFDEKALTHRTGPSATALDGDRAWGVGSAPRLSRLATGPSIPGW